MQNLLYVLSIDYDMKEERFWWRNGSPIFPSVVLLENLRMLIFLT